MNYSISCYPPFVYDLLVFTQAVLTDLLEMTNRAPSPTAPVARRPSDNGVEFDNNNGAVQFRMLSDLARIALTSSGGGDGDGGARANPKARSRALALDCLRLGLLCFPDGDSSKAVGFSNALDIAAVGAKDDRWNVRVAAVGVAREALRNGEVGTLPSLLSSKQVMAMGLLCGGVARDVVPPGFMQ